MSARAFLRAAAGLLAGGALAGALAAFAAPAPAAAQTLAERVAAAPDGTLRFEFPVRPGVCANGDRVSVSRGGHPREWEHDCQDGPGRVSLDVAAHRVTALRFYVGGRWSQDAAPATNLGAVPAAQAATFLLDLAAHAQDRVARDAIFPASIAEGVVVWPRLLDLARDGARPGSVREAATFWLSQQAAEAATRGLAEIVRDDGDRRVRRAAVFALSQRPRDEAVPALLEIARTNRDPDLRRQAIFWLGQTHDPRALDFLREVLAAK